jgi:hypothetical protein
MPVGLSPTTASEVNLNTGSVAKQFAQVRTLVHQQQSWLLAVDLTAEPYLMSDEDQTTIKSAFTTLDETLQAYDMTFITMLLGLPTG